MAAGYAAEDGTERAIERGPIAACSPRLDVDPGPPSLIEELQRRRVFRAIGGYGVVAFALIQLAEPVMHALHLPDAVLTWLVLALAAGFPITVVVAWIFDLDAGHAVRTAPLPGARPAGRTWPVLVALGLAASAPGLVWYFGVRGPPRSPEPAQAAAAAEPARPKAEAAPSIAVLPLVNLSSDKEQEYFSDGLTEELLNLLAKVPGLKVAARTSAFAVKGKSVKMSEVGQELGVATLLEGSVRRSGDRVRVTTQLINAADGYHLWSETYDRKLTDIFALQDEIASAVVAALKLKLLPGQAPGLGEARTGSTDAYLAYLEGRKLLAEAGSILRFNLARGPEALARRAADLHVFEDDSDHNTLVTSASPVAAVERFLGG